MPVGDKKELELEEAKIKEEEEEEDDEESSEPEKAQKKKKMKKKADSLRRVVFIHLMSQEMAMMVAHVVEVVEVKGLQL